MTDHQSSQSAQILAYLKEGNSITPLEALQKFGCLRLAARISDLRADNHKIETKQHRTENGKTVAQYTLKSAA